MTNIPFIIAEIGVNHDGSLSRALELVQIAKQSGADAVKLQIFRAEELMNPAATFAQYQQSRVSDANPIAMLQRYELSDDALHQLVQSIQAAGLIPLATPFSLPDLDTIASLNLPLIKIASPDIVNYPLLKAAAKLNKSLLLSTGASTFEEITETLTWLSTLSSFRIQDSEFPPLSLLHCISSYPTPTNQTHLSWISQLASQFHLPIGYSDHSTEVISGALAVAAGATLLERHLTYDKRAQGPDHSASSDPAEFAEYTRLARLAFSMLGTGPKRVLPIEQDVRTVSRQSLATARDLPANHPLIESDLKPQRPGTGIPARLLPTLLGRRTTSPIPANTLLTPSMLS